MYLGSWGRPLLGELILPAETFYATINELYIDLVHIKSGQEGSQEKGDRLSDAPLEGSML